MYELIKTQPVAKFYYKGTKTHPVQRTVLITESNKDFFKGYEIRSGAEVRDVDQAPIKSFRRDEIARVEQLRSDSALRKTMKKDASTMTRMSINRLNEVGV